jgi:hypothetical protein
MNIDNANREFYANFNATRIDMTNLHALAVKSKPLDLLFEYSIIFIVFKEDMVLISK